MISFEAEGQDIKQGIDEPRADLSPAPAPCGVAAEQARDRFVGIGFPAGTGEPPPWRDEHNLRELVDRNQQREHGRAEARIHADEPETDGSQHAHRRIAPRRAIAVVGNGGIPLT